MFIDGPNIWRISAGDKIIWIGMPRPDIESKSGILKIFVFSECALVIGEPIPGNPKDFVSFGKFDGDIENKRLEQVRYAINIVKGMGVPRKISYDWCLG